MNKDTDKVVDFCRYRERQARAHGQPFAHPRAALARPLFLLAPFPVPVPVPIIWFPYSTMMRPSTWQAAAPRRCYHRRNSRR